MLSIIPSKRIEQLAAHRERSDLAFVQQQTADFPESFIGRLVDQWRGKRHADPQSANLNLLQRSASIRRAQRAGVPADANDEQICQEAAALARDTVRRLDLVRQVAAVELADRTLEQRERLTMLGLVLEAVKWLEMRGVSARFLRVAARSIPGALKRLGCERWWRAVLRGLHARAVESTARAIGLVHKRAGCYVSDDSLNRRRGQVVRNLRGLESVLAVNEYGQDATLAELAAKGPANRQIRRHELMTRIAGFELIAKECGHIGLFITVTCPSRMHAWRTKPGQHYGVEANPKHDGTTPDEAQAYLCRQWRNFSEACRRKGVELYGFRIAEPNHDGTPHWHILVFMPKRPTVGLLSVRAGRVGLQHFDAVCQVNACLRTYFLHSADANERGARKRRITVEPIDWTRGTAAGYIAKYVSKNIDGYKVEKDLYGNPTLTSSQRVDAWASTWRIRQFQQVGGAPVGVWRELRRLHPEQVGASAGVAFGLDAVNVTESAALHESDLFERVTAANGWAAYLHLQGGHRVPRRLQRLRVLKEQTGELGRYGELMAAKAVGVVTDELVQTEVLGRKFAISKRIEVESERATWRMQPMGLDASESSQALRRGRLADRLRGLLAGGAAARPWSPVNNCTRREVEPKPMFVERTKKRGRWHQWQRPRTPSGGPPVVL